MVHISRSISYFKLIGMAPPTNSVRVASESDEKRQANNLLHNCFLALGGLLSNVEMVQLH